MWSLSSVCAPFLPFHSLSPSRISGRASMLAFSETKKCGMQESGSSFNTEVTCSAENTSAELSLYQLM